MEKGRVGLAKGWNNYPANLEAIEHLSFHFDYHDYREQLKSDSHRLFGDDEKVTVKVTEIGLDGEWWYALISNLMFTN